jgi:hypothetical protein
MRIAIFCAACVIATFAGAPASYAQDTPAARLNRDDVNQLVAALAAHEVTELPLPASGTAEDTLRALQAEAKGGAGGSKLPAAAAAELGRLAERALTGLPVPRPFPFHLDAAFGFHSADTTVLLLVCRICGYGTLYLQRGERTIASGRIAIDEMSKLLPEISEHYRSAPGAQ